MQIDFRRRWAQAERVCRLGIRLLTNLGSGDFLVIAESLVFSCLGIIRWWRDIMRRWIPDPISAGYYRCHPCPWLPSLVLNYPLKLSLFFFEPPPPFLFPQGVICASHTISSPALPLNTSPPSMCLTSMCLTSEPEIVCDKHTWCDHA